MNRILGPLFKYSPLLILAAIWQLIAISGIVSKYSLPPLTTVIVAWWHMLADPDYYLNVFASVRRAASGLGAAAFIGVILGTSLAWWRWAQVLIAPIVQLFYPMPKVALIPLTIIWFGIGDMSKIFLIFIGCLLPITMATYSGVKGVERTLLWSAASLGASRWKIMSEIAFRAATPDILAGGRTALALSFVLIVSSELIMSNEGLGFLIRIYGDGSQYPQMFACSLTIMLLGFTADQAYGALMRHLLRWRA
jgi:NitT/TauT family transport system permease protein